MIKILKVGVSGPFVSQWQNFLRGQGFFLNVSGTFDEATRIATLAFQEQNSLDADGVVGNQTLGKAISMGLEIVDYSESELDYPSKPPFAPLTNNADRQLLFGPLEFSPNPTSQNPEAIRITNNWEISNIDRVKIPQLVGITGANASGNVYFHKKAIPQLLGFWESVEKQGLLSLVLTYEGAYNPRFVRGRADEQILSNHAFGTAFDINYRWNKLGAEPATSGTQGCVYKLVPIAHQFGFYWGGHFSRRDGMHFEVAKIL